MVVDQLPHWSGWKAGEVVEAVALDCWSLERLEVELMPGQNSWAWPSIPSSKDLQEIRGLLCKESDVKAERKLQNIGLTSDDIH